MPEDTNNQPLPSQNYEGIIALKIQDSDSDYYTSRVTGSWEREGLRNVGTGLY